MIDLKSLSETSNGLVFSTARIIQRRGNIKTNSSPRAWQTAGTQLQ